MLRSSCRNSNAGNLLRTQCNASTSSANARCSAAPHLVALLAAVEDDHPAAGASQDERCAEPCWAASCESADRECQGKACNGSGSKSGTGSGMGRSAEARRRRRRRHLGPQEPPVHNQPDQLFRQTEKGGLHVGRPPTMAQSSTSCSALLPLACCPLLPGCSPSAGGAWWWPLAAIRAQDADEDWRLRSKL